MGNVSRLLDKFIMLASYLRETNSYYQLSPEFKNVGKVYFNKISNDKSVVFHLDIRKDNFEDYTMKLQIGLPNAEKEKEFFCGLNFCKPYYYMSSDEIPPEDDQNTWNVYIVNNPGRARNYGLVYDGYLNNIARKRFNYFVLPYKDIIKKNLTQIMLGLL